jgi:hypothetical protein
VTGVAFANVPQPNPPSADVAETSWIATVVLGTEESRLAIGMATVTGAAVDVDMASFDQGDPMKLAAAKLNENETNAIVTLIRSAVARAEFFFLLFILCETPFAR